MPFPSMRRAPRGSYGFVAGLKPAPNGLRVAAALNTTLTFDLFDFTNDDTRTNGAFAPVTNAVVYAISVAIRVHPSSSIPSGGQFRLDLAQRFQPRGNEWNELYALGSVLNATTLASYAWASQSWFNTTANVMAINGRGMLPRVRITVTTALTGAAFLDFIAWGTLAPMGSF